MDLDWLGGGLLAAAIAACAGWWARPREVSLPHPGPKVLEGTVRATRLGSAPLGGPTDYAVAHVQVSVSSQGGRSPQWKSLLSEVRGSPSILLETGSGPREIALGDPMTTWFGFGGGTETRLASLEADPALARLPGQDVPNRLGFVVTVRGVRQGERLLVELGPDGRTAARIWRGGREGFTAAARGGAAAGASRSSPT